MPNRIALLLGIGAMATTGAAQADARPLGVPEPPLQVPQQGVADFGHFQLWSEAGRIYLSEGGGDVRELRLGDTAEARALHDLLERCGASAARPHMMRRRIILVGGGGMGVPPEPSPEAMAPRSKGDQHRAPPAAQREHASLDGAPARRGKAQR